MPQESVRQIQLKDIVFFFVSLSWVSSNICRYFLMEKQVYSYETKMKATRAEGIESR